MFKYTILLEHIVCITINLIKSAHPLRMHLTSRSSEVLPSSHPSNQIPIPTVFSLPQPPLSVYSMPNHHPPSYSKPSARPTSYQPTPSLWPISTLSLTSSPTTTLPSAHHPSITLQPSPAQWLPAPPTSYQPTPSLWPISTLPSAHHPSITLQPSPAQWLPARQPDIS